MNKRSEIQIATNLYNLGWRVERGDVVLKFERDEKIAVVKYPSDPKVTRLIQNLQNNGTSTKTSN